jgi:hypothetical protein
MRAIEPSLTPEILRHIDKKAVDIAKPFPVKTFRELVKQVAKLSYLNKDQMLFFRGQNQDYKNKIGASTFYPSIYRGDYLPRNEVKYRFELLNQAARKLVDLFGDEKITGFREVRRKKYIQWSILQHYEICSTPLLDFTQSTRVACAFAQMAEDNNEGYVYVFGLPYVTNRISVNSEHDIVNVRLLSICPPDALRPYFQDGYLAGTEDLTIEYESKTELDFKNRLIAKFIIPNGKKFWGRGFSKIPNSVLYPKGDRVGTVCDLIKSELKYEIQPGHIGEFLKEWSELESLILEKSKYKKDPRVYSTRKAISILHKKYKFPQYVLLELDFLRKFRNKLVHQPKNIEPFELQKNITRLIEMKKFINDFIKRVF